ncbi:MULTISPECIES: EAL domain-containing protein [Caloramator]|nr:MULTISPECIES: EAL domain-containing protein [Caloramator]MDO6353955.1 EAL domain-containing protein [Caloramator sp. CAR-1]
MKIQNRLTKDISIVALIVLVLTFFIFKKYIFDPVTTFEKQIAYDKINRLEIYINKQAHMLYSLSLDYSKWDETYKFVETKNSEYINSNFNYDISFDKNGVNFLFITDKSGNIIYERYNQNSYDDEFLNKKIKTSILPLINKYILSIGKDTLGVENLYNTPVLLSIQTIQDSNASSPPKGYFIVGKYLNKEEIREIDNDLTVNIDSIEKTNFLDRSLKLNDNLIYAKTTFKNIFNLPSVSFTIRFERIFYREAIKNIMFFSLTSLLLVLTSILIFVFRLRKSILNRIMLIKDIINTIEKTSNLELRLPIDGDDEIDILSRDINSMLDKFKLTSKRLKESLDDIYYLAYHDSLTQLPNRLKAVKHIEELINAKRPFYAILLDIDNFKNINDMYGHDLGDAVLKFLSKKLQNNIKKNKFIARIGGDEFLIILENLSGTFQIQNIVNDIINLLSKPLHLKSDKLYIEASIGIAEFPKDGSTLKSLLKNVEIAMYECKKKKLKYQYFNPALNEKALTTLTLSNKLKQCIENNEFIIFYQPIYSLKENKVCSAEALVRLSLDNKIIPPNQFIPIARELGLLPEIDNFVLTNSIKQCKIWMDSGVENFSISINTSFKQIIDENFVEFIKDTITKFTFSPQNVILEITEEEALEDLERVAEILNKLKELGVKIAIDDFGTGYSSLNYIARLPIDILKIDRSLINNIKDEKNIEIIKAIISMANSLKLSVIVEGIENKLQLEILKELNVEKIQGYLIDKPLPKEEFEAKYIKGC